MSNEPLVTIIIPSYNSKDYILETIDSVIKQTYQNWEMIIVDDCSNDGSYEIIQKYICKNDRVHLCRLESNSGCPAVPRNFALQMAKGEYIAFLDSDDIWHNQKLDIQLNLMKQYNVEFGCSSLINFSDFKTLNIESEVMNEDSLKVQYITFAKLIKKNIIPNSSVIISRTLLSNFRFNEDMRYKAIEDYHLWLRILEATNTKAIKIKMNLLYYRLATTSISKSKISMLKKNYLLYSEYQGLGIKKYLYLTTYIYYSLVRVLRGKM